MDQRLQRILPLLGFGILLIIFGASAYLAGLTYSNRAYVGALQDLLADENGRDAVSRSTVAEAAAIEIARSSALFTAVGSISSLLSSIVGGATLVAIIAGYRETLKTTEAAKESAAAAIASLEISRRSQAELEANFALEQRPWIILEIRVVDVDVIQEPGAGGRFAIEYLLHNAGKTPAIVDQVEVYATNEHMHEFGLRALFAAQERAKKSDWKQRHEGAEEALYVIGPGMTLRHGHSASMMSHRREDRDFGGWLGISVAVLYRSLRPGPDHHTVQSIEVTIKHGGNAPWFEENERFRFKPAHGNNHLS